MTGVQTCALPISQEEAITTRWLQGVKDAARLEYGFGVEVAECADLIKGYSGTYRRGVHNFNLIFEKLIDPAISQLKPAMAAVNGARTAANADPDGTRLDDFIASAR